jgi:hypothetical protein
VVGSDDDGCTPGTTCSFLRRGFPEGTQLAIDDFRPPPTDGVSARITTEPYGAFDRTELLQIGPLEHDQLSLLDFPGDGRLRNFIFAAKAATGPLANRDAIVILSLMENRSLEARVIVGSGDETQGDHFGLFLLEKE